MKTQFESLKTEKFSPLDTKQHQAVRGGDPRVSDASGKFMFSGRMYDFDGDIIGDDGKWRFWVPVLKQYVVPD